MRLVLVEGDGRELRDGEAYGDFHVLRFTEVGSEEGLELEMASWRVDS